MSENGLTIDQAAALLGVSRQAVNSLIGRARLYASNENGKWHVEAESLAEYALLRLGELQKEENKLKNLLKSVQ